MMPGIHGLRCAGPSPALDPPASALRHARPNLVDLRNQQHQQQAQMQAQGFVVAQRAEADRGPGLTSAAEHKQTQPQTQLDSAMLHAQGPLPLAFAQRAVQEQLFREHGAGSRHSGSSSGSEHEPSSDYLAGLVSDFMDLGERERDRAPWTVGNAPLSAEEDGDSDATLLGLSASIQALSSSSTPLESRLLSDVLRALQLARSSASLQQDTDASAPLSGSALRRAVMSRLRAAGYNAAVCKTRWDHSRGYPGGDYEYIDVLFPSESPLSPGVAAPERVVVDLDFRAQFQVARLTPQFEAALLGTPVLFVGRTEKLQQLVEMLSDACRRSLRVLGMHLPPWRKAEYLRAKWFAPYKRTVNPVPSAQSSAAITSDFAAVSTPVTPKRVENVSPLTTFGKWPETQQDSGIVPWCDRPVIPRRIKPAPRGVLGMLLQQNMLEAAPVS